ncbi:MAG: hypothetical protein MUF83_12980 [Acidimicrobiales bacterium]|nr:hypothetical protein [Acidimicrobiales bacterium]
MVFALADSDTLAYRIFFLLHLLAVVVGFGSTFVYPMLAAKARKLPPSEAGAAYNINKAAMEVSKSITTPAIWAAGAFGVILILLSEDAIEFSDPWISIAFLLFFAGVGISYGLHTPNLKAMGALQEKLVNGEVTPPAGGGPPAEVAELQARGKRAAMYGGLLHLLFLLLMIDMIWKPS